MGHIIIWPDWVSEVAYSFLTFSLRIQCKLDRDLFCVETLLMREPRRFVYHVRFPTPPKLIVLRTGRVQAFMSVGGLPCVATGYQGSEA